MECISDNVLFHYDFPIASTVLLAILSLYYSQTLRTYIASQGYESLFVYKLITTYQFIVTAAGDQPLHKQLVGG